jgi:hypothetical protein
MIRRVALCCLLYLAFMGNHPHSLPAQDRDKAPQGTGSVPKKARTRGEQDSLRLSEILGLLNAQLDMNGFQQPMKLREALGLLHESAEKMGTKLPVLVDVEAFREDNPDAEDVQDTDIFFPLHPKKMPFASALRVALSQVKTRNATFLVRRGIVEITTVNRANLGRLLQERIFAEFDKRPLGEVFEELSVQTGASVLVDDRQADKLQTLITARFRNDVTLEDALTIVSDHAGLKIVRFPSALYVTSPDNARVLEAEKRTTPRKKKQAP